jgi:hypothetical protein
MELLARHAALLLVKDLMLLSGTCCDVERICQSGSDRDISDYLILGALWATPSLFKESCHKLS